MTAYAYRLVVVIPPECLRSDFVPEPILEKQASDGWGRDYDHDPFSWPRRRLYFDWSAACHRASLLRSWGATVTVERTPLDRWEYVKTWGDEREEVSARRGG